MKKSLSLEAELIAIKYEISDLHEHLQDQSLYLSRVIDVIDRDNSDLEYMKQLIETSIITGENITKYLKAMLERVEKYE